MEGSGESKSVKLPTFDGDQKKFQIWWTRFHAYATVYKFNKALAVEGDADLPTDDAVEIDVETDEGRLQEAAKKRNSLAMANLSMAFTTEGTMQLIYKAMSTEWPEGKASEVIKHLLKKYKPQDTITRVELRQKLNKITMKRNADPATLFEQISSIENQYNMPGRKIDEDDLIAVVLDAAPAEYQAVLKAEQRRRGTDLCVADLEEAMNQHWRQTQSPRTGGNDKNDNNEVSLAAGDFGGTCYRCKKKGHRANQCPEKKGGDAKNVEGKKDVKYKKGRFQGKCHNCGKEGHKEADCWFKDENKDKRPEGFKVRGEQGNAGMDSDNNRVEFMLCGMTFPNTQELLQDPNVWIADTAATVHMTPHEMGCTNARKASEVNSITMGNGSNEKAKKIVDIPCTACDKHGNQLTEVKMQDVTVIPGGKFNRFSVSKMIKEGWELGGNKTAIWLVRNEMKVTFDIVIPTPKGVLFAIYLKRKDEVGGAGQDTLVKMSLVQAHDKLGHMSEDATRKTAKQLGWHMTPGRIHPCESCTAGKAKQKNVPKASEHVSATRPNERIYLDIAAVKKGIDKKLVTKPYWRIMVDEATQLKFSDFFETKNGMIEPTCEKLFKWKQNDKAVKYIRMDNGGENKGLESRANSVDWKLNLKFEYTGRETPQRNHLAELGFAILANRGRAMMYRANLPIEMRYKLWREAFKTATLLDGLTVITLNGKTATRFEHWAGKLPEFAGHLRTWGEAGTVKIKTVGMAKVQDRGVPCMMVGYALNHPGDTYRMFNKKTGGIHETRDIIWLRRMYFAKSEKTNKEMRMNDGINDDDDFGIDIEVGEGRNNRVEAINEGNDNDDDDNEPTNDGDVDDNETGSETDENGDENGDGGEWTPVRTRTGRAVVPPTRLIEEIGACASDLTNANYYSVLEVMDEEIPEEGEIGCIGAGIGGGFESTSELHAMKYDAAMKTKDAEHWKNAVEKEHERMVENQVWNEVPRSELPKNAKVLTSTWAMKKKANGTFRARLNARGYEQVDGLHYDSQTTAAPVTNETTIKVIFVLMTMAKWSAELLDVRGAFLKGRFEEGEQLYMEIPQGFESKYRSGQVLKLRRTIYGLKQAAYAFWRELLMAFASMGYTRSKADPCLYYKWTDDGLVTWLSWVDDCLVTGPKAPMMKAKNEMMSLFDCDEIGELNEYVGCKIVRDRENHAVQFTQPVLIQSFEDEFTVPDGDDPVTPANPGEILKGGEPKNYVDKQTMSVYRSGVGKLLHLMKWSRPDIQNAVRELSRYMMSAVEAHVVAMYRVMKYCLATRDIGLTIKPSGHWDGKNKDQPFIITGYSDSDYAKDLDTRRSVSGYAVFLNDAPVVTKSKMQNCVTLSVTEAELVSATQCAQDMLYVMRLLESLGLTVQKPMILRVDNRGAVDLANNWSVGGRTRHVEVRYYYLRELKEQGILRVEWVATAENCSDMFTKNLHGPTFWKHTMNFCDTVSPELRDTQGEGVRGAVDKGPGKRVTWVGQTDKTTSDWDKTKTMTVGKVTNMGHREGNEGDQYKSYKEVIKEGNDRSYALPNKGHGGDRGRGKTK